MNGPFPWVLAAVGAIWWVLELMFGVTRQVVALEGDQALLVVVVWIALFLALMFKLGLTDRRASESIIREKQ